MFKLRSSKRKSSTKSSSVSIEDESLLSSSPRYPVVLDQSQFQLLVKWLEQLNREKLITITDPNDIVILSEGKTNQSQQIFVNCDDITILKKKGVLPNYFWFCSVC